MLLGEYFLFKQKIKIKLFKAVAVKGVFFIVFFRGLQGSMARPFGPCHTTPSAPCPPEASVGFSLGASLQVRGLPTASQLI